MVVRSTAIWDVWSWLRRPGAPEPPPAWERRISALEIALSHERTRADRLEVVADQLNDLVRAWMELNAHLQAKVDDLQAEIGEWRTENATLKAENAALSTRVASLETQALDFPPLRERAFKAEMAARIWRGDDMLLRRRMADAGLPVPVEPDIPEV